MIKRFTKFNEENSYNQEYSPAFDRNEKIDTSFINLFGLIKSAQWAYPKISDEVLMAYHDTMDVNNPEFLKLISDYELLEFSPAFTQWWESYGGDMDKFNEVNPTYEED